MAGFIILNKLHVADAYTTPSIGRVYVGVDHDSADDLLDHRLDRIVDRAHNLPTIVGFPFIPINVYGRARARRIR